MPVSTRSIPPYDIQERTFRFAVEIVRFHRNLPAAGQTLHAIADQLLKAATSVGANMEEAKAASSRRDFVAKAAIGLRECREALYWLRLVTTSELVAPQVVNGLLHEADELVAILTTIVRRARTTLLLSIGSHILAGLAFLISSFFILHSKLTPP